MSKLAAVLAAAVLVTAANRNANALDYNINRKFDVPIGQGDNWNRDDFVTYDARTGQLVYHVGQRHQGHPEFSDFWWPPDLASVSGAFLPNAALLPVPLTSFDQPSFHTNEVIEGAVVPGSNGIHVSYDGYAFWPIWPNESTFAAWGVVGIPTTWDFGRVLPAGLTESFLRGDLYAFPDVGLVVVPEPTSAFLCSVMAASVAIYRQRGKKKN